MINPANGKARNMVLSGASCHIPLSIKTDPLSPTTSGGFELKKLISAITPISPAIACARRLGIEISWK